MRDRSQCTLPPCRAQFCVVNYGRVRSENATSLLLAAGLTAAGGYFTNSVTTAVANAGSGACFGLSPSCTDTTPPPLSCAQLRAAVAGAAVLAERYGWGSAQQVSI